MALTMANGDGSGALRGKDLPEGQALQSALGALYQRAKARFDQEERGLAGLWTACSGSKSTFYGQLKLDLGAKQHLPWRFVLGLYRAAYPRGGSADSGLGVPPLGEVVQLVVRFHLAVHLELLAREVRAEEADELAAELPDLVGNWAEGGPVQFSFPSAGVDFPSGRGGTRAGPGAAGGWHGGDDHVAPVPLSEGDRRNRGQGGGMVAADGDGGAVALAGHHWAAGRLPDALHVVRVIAADCTPGAVVGAIREFQRMNASAMVDSLISAVAGQAAADPRRVVCTVRLLAEAGLQGQAKSLEESIGESTVFPLRA